jgi:hypothetical protein
MQMIQSNRGHIYNFEKCPKFCKKCLDKLTCTKCEDSHHLILNQCLPICDDNSYATRELTCEKCKEPCEKCINSTNCSKCVPGKNLLEGKCFAKCPQEYFSSNSKCNRCHLKCETCKGPDSDNCLSCALGFKLANSKCLSQCPEGTYYETALNECTICNSDKCIECIKTATTCTKCADPLALDIKSFTCKPCCSRSIHGTVSLISCCNCPAQFNGYCSQIDETLSKFTTTNNNLDLNANKTHNSASYYVFAVMLIIVVFFLIIASVLSIRPLLAKRREFGSVLYTSLVDSAID